VSRAVGLAGWLGQGRAVTSKGVLRPADVRAAAAALDIGVAAHIRTGADVAAIHRPWVVAQALGTIVVDATRAVAQPAGSGLDPLTGWLAGLDAVLREESRDDRREEAGALCQLLLAVLASDPPPSVGDLEATVHDYLRQRYHEDEDIIVVAFRAFHSGVKPVDATLELLGEFGAVDGAGRLTALGRWAHEQFQARVPRPVTADLPAGEVLARLALLPDDQRWRQALRWLDADGRSIPAAAGELLRAAADATAAERVAAVDVVADLGNEVASPAWRAVSDLPNLAAHARWMLADEDPADGDRADEPGEAVQQWLITEYAMAAFTTHGVQEAYHYVQDRGGPGSLGDDHPDAVTLRAALTDFSHSGGGQVPTYQLKIALSRVRPPVWRRVLVPASVTLGLLHQVIQVAFDWDGDHLHAFTVDGRRYSDPFMGLDDCGDEEVVRLMSALPRLGASMSYVYDMGDWWEHDITLEKVLDPDGTTVDPVCVAGRGDAPVEDWNPEYPQDPTLFDQQAINRGLAALTAYRRSG